MSRTTLVRPADPFPGPPVAPGQVPAPGSPAGVVRRVVLALLVAVAAGAGIVALWRVFLLAEHGQAVDQASLEGAHIGQTRLWDLAEPVLDVVSVGFIAAAIITCGAIAIIRRRWSLALVAAVVLGGANVTTRVLKLYVLDRPDLGHGPLFNTLPSGHTTAAASVAVAVLLVVPPRVRPWIAVLGAGYAGATGVSTLIGQWHRPSDVLAGLLVVLAWGAIGCALLAMTPAVPEDRRPPTAALPTVARARRGDTVGTRVALGLLGAATVLAGSIAAVALRSTWRAADPLGTRGDLLTAYAGGALGILATAALTFGLLLVLRRDATSGSVRGGGTW
jgi:membrane-associated phospholipid phosphatase